MHIVDLSHKLFNGMPTYPSDPKVKIIKEKEINSDRCELHIISMGTHTGTHLDAPAHIINGGKTLSDFPINAFMGRAIKVDQLTFNRLQVVDEKIEAIIYDTGWHKNFDDPTVFYGKLRPKIPEGLIKQVLKMNIGIFGCDLPSVDISGSKEKSIHHSLLGNDIIIYESLANLGELQLLEPFDFYGFPLSLFELDGSPVRAVGLMA